MDNFLDISWSLLQGFGLTCAIFFITLIIALPLGLLLSFGTMCRFRTLRAILKTFIWKTVCKYDPVLKLSEGYRTCMIKFTAVTENVSLLGV